MLRILPFVGLALVIAACASDETTAQLTEQYANEEVGYSIGYPAGWEIADSLEGITLVGPDGTYVEIRVQRLLTLGFLELIAAELSKVKTNKASHNERDGARNDDDPCPDDVFCNSESAYVFSLAECGIVPIPAI